MFALRCRSRSWVLHLWLFDSEHSAGGASWNICRHHGWSTSRSSCWSVSTLSTYPQRNRCYFTSHHPFCPVRKYQTTGRISWSFFSLFSFLMFHLNCEQKKTFNKITKEQATVSTHLPFISSLKHFLLSLQGRRSTCSCGCVISNWGPLLWTSIRLLG